MANNTCLIYPQVNGKDSELYKDLLKSIGDRQVVNWIYACYRSSNAAAAMDAKKFKRDRNGEHNAKDLRKFIGFDVWQKEIRNFSAAQEQAGATDHNGNTIDYADAKTALDKADDFNDNHSGLVATVIQHGDIYNIVLFEKSARTHMLPVEVKERLKIWDVYKQAFNGIGIDIENVHQDLKGILNANNVDITRKLEALKSAPSNFLWYTDALLLFTLGDQGSSAIQNIIRTFGSIEAAAQALEDDNRYTHRLTGAQRTLLDRAVAHCKQMQGLDVNALKNQVSSMSDQVRNSNPETDIMRELNKLKRQYRIDLMELHVVSDKIDSLSKAASEAAFQLERRIREIKKQQGNNAEGKRLGSILNQLLAELARKKYYSGILNFFNEATAMQAEVQRIVNTPPVGNTEREKAFDMARKITEIKKIRDQYYPVISALADPHITIDESIDQVDIDNLRRTATDLKNFFDEQQKNINKIAESTMQIILQDIIGDTAPDGQIINNLVKMAQKDSTWFDFLYSAGTVSNPMVAALGTVILNAKEARNAVMNAFSERIRKATDKLYKSGSNSEFIYVEDGIHIISDIDWEAYEEARTLKAKSLRQLHLSDWDFRQAMMDWEEQNTEDRVVDEKSGRVERVPDKRYRNNQAVWDDVNHKVVFNPGVLTTAQQEYYDTMMQIKGEIGTFLPMYAQDHYRAPQIRRDMMDAISHARNAGDVLKAIGRKMEELTTIREDDTNYSKNGIIDGEEYSYVATDYDNTPLREIPIFYINKVQKGELLLDFSAGLQALAGTAINYNMMHDVEDVVNFMGDFIKDKKIKSDDNQSDVLGNSLIRLVKTAYNKSISAKTSDVVEGFIDSLVYGIKRNPSETRKYGKWSKFVDNLIAYTSFKGLASNVKGMISNYLVGEMQMLIEAGAGEFYGLGDYAWAHTKLFGGAGVGGEIMELFTDNMNHKATLFKELFDPLNENFSSKSHQRYHKNFFRKLLGHDCAFIGYTSGEYLIHYVNMYAILHHQKVFKNGKEIPLYDAFSVGNKENNNSELVVDPDVTIGEYVNGKWIDTGRAVDQEYLTDVKLKIQYCNQTTHGAMNEEDKGLIHRRMLGRLVMNFRQWMIGHYSRRFRARYFDYRLGTDREGYWRSVKEGLATGEGGEAWKDKEYLQAMGYFARDIVMFTFRAQSQWSNLDEMQRYNVKRAHSELVTFLSLLMLSFALGEPEDHKKERWYRMWIYQTRRLLMETEASMPHPAAISNIITILQSPMAGISTVNSILYIIYGLFNGDIAEKYQRGPHKGENKYWWKFRKNALPFFKDWDQLQNMDTEDGIFKVFDNGPK